MCVTSEAQFLVVVVFFDVSVVFHSTPLMSVRDDECLASLGRESLTFVAADKSTNDLDLSI